MGGAFCYFRKISKSRYDIFCDISALLVSCCNAASTSIKRTMSARNRRPKSELEGYLLECNVPTMKFIQNLEETMRKNPKERVFIMEQLDATHAWIRKSHKDLIDRKVDEWLDSNIWSSVEQLDQDLDLA